MNIGKVIYDLRKARGLTQEQLANMVGVSVPAVSKWETGSSFPDITLLSPIARALKTNVDYLLSYTLDLTEQEVETFKKDIEQIFKEKGYKKGIEYARNLLKEYPNSDYLKLHVAMCPMQYSFLIDEGYSEEEYNEVMEPMTKLLEEVVNSDNPEIRNAAKIALCTRYMSKEMYTEAEQLLESIPRKEYSARHLLPTLSMMKEEDTKALNTSEQNLLMDLQYIRTDLVSMYNVMMKRENYDKALLFAKNYYEVSMQYGNFLPSGADLLVMLYLKINDIDNALKWFEIYVDDIISLDMNYENSPFLADIAQSIVVATNEKEEDIKIALYKSILFNPKFEVLKKHSEYHKCLDKLKKVIGNR